MQKITPFGINTIQPVYYRQTNTKERWKTHQTQSGNSVVQNTSSLYLLDRSLTSCDHKNALTRFPKWTHQEMSRITTGICQSIHRKLSQIY